MDINHIGNNPRTLATRDEELAFLLWNDEQSATPNLQHATILYYYIAMTLLQFRNIPPPLNMGRFDYSPTPTPTTLPLSTRGSLQHDTADVTTTPEYTLHGEWRFGLHWGVCLALIAIYIAMCAFLLDYVQWRFESETYSPFQTHLGFIIMSIAAFFMTLFTSGIVVYTNNNLQSLMKHHFSPVYDVILKCVFWFSSILTPLSLLLLLFVPHKFNWTGYLIVCALFVAILAFNFKTLKRLLAPKHTNNLGPLEMV